MARKSKQDAVKAKAAKQKKIAIGGGVLLVALLAIQGPKTLKMLNPKPLPPLTAPSTPTAATPTVTPSDPNSLAAPTLGGTPTAAPAAAADTSNLVDAVPVSADAGQLEAFQRFASKDPFAAQATADGAPVKSGGGSSPSKSSGGNTPSKTPTLTPSAPSSPSSPSSPSAPTNAVISLNGEVMGVTVGGDFPTTGATFQRAGSLFHLVSLTARTAKIAIVGGSYADGAPAITLKLGTPLTLQNTADGTKYTLILEPPTTSLPGSTGTVASAPTSTTSAVPSGSGG